MDNINEPNELFVTITDVDGVEHSYKLLTTFVAGNLQKDYCALLCQDILLYRYYIMDGREIAEEISDIDYAGVNAHWMSLQGNISEDSVRSGTLYMLDQELGEYVPVTGTIIQVFTPPFGGEFVAFFPTAIHFYRYELDEVSNNISFDTIVSPREYEDVANAFSMLMESGL